MTTHLETAKVHTGKGLEAAKPDAAIGDQVSTYRTTCFSNQPFLVIGTIPLNTQEEVLKNTLRPNAKINIITQGNYTAAKVTQIIQEYQTVKGLSNSTRLIPYDLTPAIFKAANDTGLKIWENPESAIKLNKSGVHNVIEDFVTKNPDLSITPLGKTFEGKNQMTTIASELFEQDLGVVIKIDNKTGHTPFHSGKGIFVIKNISEWNKTLTEIQKLNLTEPWTGIVQVFVPNTKIITISSEKNPDTSEYDLFEMHQQIQKNITIAAGGETVDTKLAEQILNEYWPIMKMIYQEQNITGGQNADIMVIEDKATRKKIAQIYGHDEKKFHFNLIDLNLRAISGTKMALLSFIQETGQLVDLNNFYYGDMPMHPLIANNPGLIYHAAETVGLNIGTNRQFSIVHYGGITQDKLLRNFEKKQLTSDIKIIVGNHPTGSKIKFKQLAALLKKPPQSLITSFERKHDTKVETNISSTPINDFIKNIQANLESMLKQK